MLNDHKFIYSFSCKVSGPSCSRNFSFCTRILQNVDPLFSERNFDGGVICCYSERTAIPKQQLTVVKGKIRFNEVVTSDFVNAHGRPCLLILDLLNDIYSNEVFDMLTKGSHHRNISVILIIKKPFLR